MKKLLIIAALSIFIASPVMAENHPKPEAKQEKLNFRKMTKEQKQQFFAEKEAAWAKMTKAEKVAELNKRHTDRITRMQENWAKKSDAEKIEQYDKRVAYAKKRQARKGKMKADCK